MFGRVATHYQTIQTWITLTRDHTLYSTFFLSLTLIDHSAMHYHNFNLLPHMLPYIFSRFNLVWGYLQGVKGVTIKFLKKIYINIFKQINSKAW